jgi:glucokinase
MYLGIDIGGTKILALLLARDGQVLGRGKKKVKAKDPESVLERAALAARLALEDASLKPSAIKAIGLAVPSSVYDGRALYAPALGWRDVPLTKLSRRHFERPVYLGNDVNMGLAAEYKQGVAKEGEIVVGFFVGTGVGGAVIHQGQLLRGRDGLAGELGHLIVVPDGRRCGCGNLGCLEAYASKTALLARLKEAVLTKRRRSVLKKERLAELEVITSSELHTAYQSKDPLVREIFDEGMQYLGLAVASVINILSPCYVVLGGGVVEAFGDPLIKKVRGWAAPHLFGNKGRSRVIVRSALGDDAVPLGAALLARGKGELL